MHNALLFALIECYALIIGFLCYVALRPVWCTLPKPWMVILSPLALLWFADVAMRCTLGWLIFMEPPTWPTITVTELCNSHINDADGESFQDYKRHIARTLCRTLNIIQPRHCSNLQS